MTDEPTDTTDTSDDKAEMPEATEYSPDLLAKVVATMKLGAPAEKAALSEGIPIEVWKEWMARGGNGEQPFAEALHQVEVAEAELEVAVIGRIRTAASTSWQAAAWLAERSWPERYARKSIAGAPGPRDNEEPSPGEDPFSDLDNVTELKSRRGSAPA